MKFSLINIERHIPQPTGKVAGGWIQNHVGTMETATAKALGYKEANHLTGPSVAIIPELSSVVPQGYWDNLTPLAVV